MYILKCLDRMFCRFLLSLLDLAFHLIHIFLCFLSEIPVNFESRILKSHITIVLDFTSNSICFLKLFLSPFRVYAFRIVVSSDWLVLEPIASDSLSSDCSLIQQEVTVYTSSCSFWFKFCFVRSENCDICFVLGSFAWDIPRSSHQKGVASFCSEVHFVESANRCILLFNLMYRSVPLDWGIETNNIQGYD